MKNISTSLALFILMLFEVNSQAQPANFLSVDKLILQQENLLAGEYLLLVKPIQESQLRNLLFSNC